MKKIVGLKIIVAIMIMLSAVCATIICVFPRREIYHSLYEQQNLEAKTGLSSFEAELNYDGIVQQIIGNEEITGMTTYPSSDDLNNKIARLRLVYQYSKWICGIGVLISVISLILLRNQKWYEVLNLGGVFTAAFSLLTVPAVFVIKPLRLFIVKSQYTELLGYDLQLAGILPEHWALYTYLVGAGMILLIGVICILLHFGARREYTPHKF